jgi:hypothetical protein
LSEIRRCRVFAHPRGLAFAIGLLLLLTFPSAAAAARCHFRVATTTYDFALSGTHGYTVFVGSDVGGRITLFARREAGDREVEYTVHGVSSRHRLQARFGKLGRIALRVRHPERGPLDVETALLEGHLAFRGEEGFTSVSIHRTTAVAVHRFVRTCRGSLPERMARASRSTEHDPVTVLAAVEKSPNRVIVVALQATNPPNLDDDSGDFLATILQERREGMKIQRVVSADAPEADLGLQAGATPFTGSVSPPRPFRGTASFSPGSDSLTTWSGDLSVSFPGAANVPLTGSSFSARACGAAGSRALDECEDDREELIEDSLLFPLFF